jgi:cytochrome c biogenesis protein CcmG, thiol:disulfide interchange protein DsbE
MVRCFRKYLLLRLFRGAVLLTAFCVPVFVFGEGIEVGRPAPNFSRPTLAGSPFQFSTVRGKVVLLNFWASWCGPCLVEMPKFAEWQKLYGADGLQIVGVSMDDERGAASEVYRKYKLNYPAVMGDAKLGDLYGGVLGLPVTYLIDRNGVVRYAHNGITDLGALEAEIKEMLGIH